MEVEVARERLDSTRSRPMTVRKRLMENNQRLAKWWPIAARRVVARQGTGHSTDALRGPVDAALFGLSLAAKTYRPEIGKFSTYAVTVMTGE